MGDLFMSVQPSHMEVSVGRNLFAVPSESIKWMRNVKSLTNEFISGSRLLQVIGAAMLSCLCINVYFKTYYGDFYNKAKDKIYVFVTDKLYAAKALFKGHNHEAALSTVADSTGSRQNLSRASGRGVSSTDYGRHSSSDGCLSYATTASQGLPHVDSSLPRRSQTISVGPSRSVDVPRSEIILASVNQYNSGGLAACTLYACDWLKARERSTRESLDRILRAPHVISQANFFEDDVENNFSESERAANPFVDQIDFYPHVMTVALPQEGGLENLRSGIGAAVHALLQDRNAVNSAVITGNDETIAMRHNPNGTIEFFDSHGSQTITGAGNIAFVKVCLTEIEAIDFLRKRYPYSYFGNDMQIYPLRLA
jgi:hypothetical protein